MSYHSEHMNITLPKGMVRGDVEIVKRVAGTELNMVKARMRSKMQYGNTKWTDADYLISLDKNNGDFKAAAKDLGCSITAITYRLAKFNIKDTNKKARKVKWADAQFVTAHKMCKGNGMKMAKLLGCSWATVSTRCRHLGLKLVGKNA